MLQTSKDEVASAKALVEGGLAQYVQPEYLYEQTGLSTPPSNRDYALEQRRVFGQMNWEGAWQKLTLGCTAPVVAVIDTGFFTARADLRPNLAPQASWLDVVGADLTAPVPQQGRMAPLGEVSKGHGTSVAGIIASTTNNGSALAGAAYNLVKVLPIKVFDANHRTGTLRVAQAIEYAAGATAIGGQTFVNPNPAQVINLSLASRKVGFSDPYLESVLERVSEGGVVVGSSGNTDLGTVAYPASSPYVIAVGATDPSGGRAQWGQGFGSNYGSDLEFVAPGTAVLTLDGEASDEYGNSYGTSAAAPFISTAVALYLYQRGHLNHPLPQGNALESVRKCLQNATQHPWQAETGYGLVDVAKVVDPANPACY
ncbi:MAG: peptidase S8 and S53 subtilisin kexin sedolisin [Meiothermus sp.]